MATYMKALSTFFILLFSFNLYSQVLTKGSGELTFIDLPKAIVALKRASVSIEQTDKNLKLPVLIGSGFLARKNNVTYAITNYHIIKSVGKDQIILVGLNLEMKKQYIFIDSTYLDEKHDIAVLKLDEKVVVANDKIDSTLLKPASVGITQIETAKNIIEGTGIVIIGYPLGLGSEYTGNKPVSRIGIIAQGPSDETNIFLLDCMASHGNSGSPVFNAQTRKLLGMVASAQPDFLNLFDDKGQLKASLPYNSGITVCITAEMIYKIIP